MTQIQRRRLCAEIEGEFVIFIIGMRINRPWKLASWLPVARAMPRMLKELGENPELGLLHAEPAFALPNLFVIEYWRSYEQLEAYARSSDHAHLPAWRDFNRAVGSSGDVGIWHETYVVQAGRYETIYNNMPPFGLGRAGALVEAVGARQTARQRITGGAETPPPD